MPGTHTQDVVAALIACADSDVQHHFLRADDTVLNVSLAQVTDQAARMATALGAAGVVAGDAVALMAIDPYEFVISFLGCVWCGAVPVPLYPPMALDALDDYRTSLSRVVEVAGCRLALTSSLVGSMLGESSLLLVDIQDLLESLPSHPPAAPRHPHHDDPVFLQFTSGSTAAPRGVVVTHGALAANCRGIAEAVNVTGTDSAVSWLPMYHDMGLIGLVLMPLFVRMPVTYIPTLSFLRRPVIWLQEIHARRATLTVAPNFAYALLSRRVEESDVAGLDLSSVRIFGCGAEPINPAVVRQFFGHFAASGADPGAFVACYGLAEATLGVAAVAPGDGLSVLTVQEADYTRDGRIQPSADGVELVSVGRPIPGHQLAVWDADVDRPVEDGRVGRVVFRGPSVCPGYRIAEGGFDASHIVDGWLVTGDLGFLLDGQLYLTGRAKDVVIVRGRNVAPQHIEWLVEQVPGIRKGNVIAFSQHGVESEELVVVAESHLRRSETARAVARTVQAGIGIAVADVVLLEPRLLPKTSSGKVRRQLTKQLYHDRRLGEPLSTRLSAAVNQPEVLG